MAEQHICAVPGCGTALYPGNRSRVCRLHNHSAWCLCVQCLASRRGEIGLSELHRASPPIVNSTETVKVTVTGTGRKSEDKRGFMEASRTVTLPRAPWEVRNA